MRRSISRATCATSPVLAAAARNSPSTTVANESHSVQTAFSALQGYYRTADFDQSPDKTFAFLPSAVAFTITTS